MFATLAGGYPADRPGPIRTPISDRARPVGHRRPARGRAGSADRRLGPLAGPDRRGRAACSWTGRRRHAARGDRPLTVDAWTLRPGRRRRRPGQAVPARAVHARRAGLAIAASGPRRRSPCAFADALAAELADLAAAGCPFIQVDEDAAVRIGSDETERPAVPSTPRTGCSRAWPAGRRSTAPVAGDHRRQRRHGRAGDDLRAGLRQLPVRPASPAPTTGGWSTRAPAERGIVLGVVDARPADRRRPGGRRLGGRLRRVERARRGPDRDRAVGQPGRPVAGGRPGRRSASSARSSGSSSGATRRRSPPPLDPRAVDARSAALGRWRPARGGPAPAGLTRSADAPGRRAEARYPRRVASAREPR